MNIVLLLVRLSVDTLYQDPYLGLVGKVDG